MTRTAACCCGACSIQVKGEPEINAVCHCADCRRRTGSAFGWSAYFRNDAVVAMLGALRTYSVRPGQNGAGAGTERAWERVFCGTCGTTLFWRAQGHEGLTGIAGGCFTAPLPEPTISLDDAARCAWLHLPEGWKTEW